MELLEDRDGHSGHGLQENKKRAEKKSYCTSTNRQLPQLGYSCTYGMIEWMAGFGGKWARRRRLCKPDTCRTFGGLDVFYLPTYVLGMYVPAHLTFFHLPQMPSWPVQQCGCPWNTYESIVTKKRGL